MYHYISNYIRVSFNYMKIILVSSFLDFGNGRIIFPIRNSTQVTGRPINSVTTASTITLVVTCTRAIGSEISNTVGPGILGRRFAEGTWFEGKLTGILNI